MTLKVVADNSVIPLDVYNFQDIAACARKFADQLEAGKQGEPTRVICVLEFADGLALSVWGENPSSYEMIGLLDAAKARAYEANFDGE